MTRYNHMAGLKIVSEVEPSERNRVELATENDDCPSLTIMAVACRIGDHFAATAQRGHLH